MKNFIRTAAVIATSSWTTASFAFFDGEVFYGSRSSKVIFDSNGTEKNKTVSGSEIGASFMIDPIPLVPVAFGVTAIQSTSDQKEIFKTLGDDTITGTEMSSYSVTASGTSTTLFYGPTVKIWVPAVPKITPYLKGAYLMGVESLDSKVSFASPAGSPVAATMELKPKTTFSHTATEMTLGVGFSPVKLTSIFVEYNTHSGKRKATSMSGSTTTTVDGTSTSVPMTNADLDTADKKSVDANSTSIRLGFSVGI
jgi:hypothetical protein